MKKSSLGSIPMASLIGVSCIFSMTISLLLLTQKRHRLVYPYKYIAIIGVAQTTYYISYITSFTLNICDIIYKVTGWLEYTSVLQNVRLDKYYMIIFMTEIQASIQRVAISIENVSTACICLDVAFTIKNSFNRSRHLKYL